MNNTKNKATSTVNFSELKGRFMIRLDFFLRNFNVPIEYSVAFNQKFSDGSSTRNRNLWDFLHF